MAFRKTITRTGGKTWNTSRQLNMSRRSVITLCIVIFALIIGGIIGVIALQLHIRDSANKSGIVTNPGYETLLPTGKSIKTLGGWERISPPQSDPVFAYSDYIGTTSVSVSEQPLPASFKNDTTSQVADLAKKFNATKKITAEDTTVYLGTSAKGPQSAIFVKGDLLVLIKSQENIKDDAWVKYITSLQ